MTDYKQLAEDYNEVLKSLMSYLSVGGSDDRLYLPEEAEQRIRTGIYLLTDPLVYMVDSYVNRINQLTQQVQTLREKLNEKR